MRWHAPRGCAPSQAVAREGDEILVLEGSRVSATFIQNGDRMEVAYEDLFGVRETWGRCVAEYLVNACCSDPESGSRCDGIAKRKLLQAGSVHRSTVGKFAVILEFACTGTNLFDCIEE